MKDKICFIAHSLVGDNYFCNSGIGSFFYMSAERCSNTSDSCMASQTKVVLI